MNYVLILGVDAGYKPIPKILIERGNLLRDAESVIDIGAGRGRFLKWFLLNTNVKRYVAVEPCTKFVKSLEVIVKKYGDGRDVEIVKKPWQEVRNFYMNEEFDVVILWDVLMFMDLRYVHGTDDFLDAVIKEVPIFSKMCRRFLLLSFHPIKKGIPELSNKEAFNKILREFVKNGFEVLDRRFLNYILVKTDGNQQRR